MGRFDTYGLHDYNDPDAPPKLQGKVLGPRLLLELLNQLDDAYAKEFYTIKNRIEELASVLNSLNERLGNLEAVMRNVDAVDQLRSFQAQVDELKRIVQAGVAVAALQSMPT